MDEKGANSFPFLKEKLVATLAIRNICDKIQNQKSVLPPYYKDNNSST